jgi:alpha-D-xyloside xylohydrolase
VIPRPFLFDRAQPIFDRTRRSFNPLRAITAVSAESDHVVLTVEADDGTPAFVRISFPDPMVARIEWAPGAVPPLHTTEMLAGAPRRLPINVAESADEVTVDAGGEVVRLSRRPWQVRFGPFATEPSDDTYFQAVNEASGWSADLETERISCYDTFRLRSAEELYGLGERFLGPGQRGRRALHWICEPGGANTTDRVHKSVPLLVSSEGYAVFYHHPEKAVFDVGASSLAAASVLVEAQHIDQFVILGSPKEVATRYTALTGRPALLPEWAYGVWMSRCMYGSREVVVEVVETARRLGVPLDVVNLDPKWLATRREHGQEACDFIWDDEAFGPLDELVAWLHERDVRLCLWVNPYVADTTNAFVPEVLVEQGRARDRDRPRRGFVDFTGPEGAAWWNDRMKALLHAGVDAFKLDFAESLPEEVRMADGRSGAEVHNLYPLLAALVASRAGAAVHFTRAGTAGSQRFPLHWAGDSQSSWAGLQGALRGGLAAAWSGFAHWTSDIGGFYWRERTAEGSGDDGVRQPEVELYIRWMQFGMLCSQTRFHGIGPREPWAFGETAVAVAKRFGALRRQLVAYLLECAQDASDHGWPVMRPMAFEFPDDPTARSIDTQYMLGPDVLVCPVLEPGGAVEFYVPKGQWRHVFTGEVVDGPEWRRAVVPLEEACVFVRVGGSAALSASRS